MHSGARTFASAAIASLALGSACARTPRGAADLVVVHAKIWTATPDGRQATDADALAIIGGRIVDVGSDEAIDRWRGPATAVVDAGGRRVVPGFNDAHVHLVEGGMRLDAVDLGDARAPAEFARRITERAKARPGEWILGGGWDARQWAGGAQPARALVDEATNGTPVFVTSADRTSALANSAALGRAGITETTPDPPGGRIVRDARGFPTGLLQGSALDLVARVVPPPTAERRIQAVNRALEHALSLGVTSMQDLSASYEDVAAYSYLASRGDLTVRVYVTVPEAGWYDEARLGLRRAFGSASLRLGAVRAFEPVSNNAAATAPPSPDVRTRLMAADHAELQLCLAAAPSSSAALDVAAGIVDANGRRDRRLRIESVQHLSEADVDRFANLGLVASVRMGSDEHDRDGRLIRALIDRRVPIAIGSEWPARSLNPMLAVEAAVLGGATVADALDAYTRGGAFAEFQEADKGTLTRGALADMVVLSDDVFRAAANQIERIGALTTIVGGKLVYHRRP